MFGNEGMQFTPQDWQQMALTAGLSMLGNNNGTRSVGQLIGKGGLDALAGLQARRRYEAAMARQQMQDEQAQAQHDMQMQKGQMELDEARSKAELTRTAASGDENAIKALAPLEWWKNKQAQNAADLAHQRALGLAMLKNGKTNGRPTYVEGMGGFANPDGTFTPVQFPDKAPDKKALPFDKASKLAGVEASYNDIQEVVGGLFDEKGNFKRSSSLLGYVPGTEAAEYENKGRAAVEAWLRAMTGAAAPKHEVDNYMSLYFPKPWDAPEVALKKLEGLEARLTGTMSNMGLSVENMREGSTLSKVRRAREAAKKNPHLSAKDGGGSYASASDHADALIKKYTQR